MLILFQVWFLNLWIFFIGNLVSSPWQVYASLFCVQRAQQSPEFLIKKIESFIFVQSPKLVLYLNFYYLVSLPYVTYLLLYVQYCNICEKKDVLIKIICKIIFLFCWVKINFQIFLTLWWKLTFNVHFHHEIKNSWKCIFTRQNKKIVLIRI